MIPTSVVFEEFFLDDQNVFIIHYLIIFLHNLKIIFMKIVYCSVFKNTIYNQHRRQNIFIGRHLCPLIYKFKKFTNSDIKKFKYAIFTLR